MNQELLSETIDIIARQLLRDPYFCGSIEGRRLRELLWDMLGKYQSKPVVQYTEPATLPRTVRTVALPSDLDNAVTAIVEKTGISRDQLIGHALAMLLAEDRLG